MKKWSTERLIIGIFVCLCSLTAHAQLADEKCKFLGNIIANSVPADFGTYWNQVTPENGGKWGTVEPAQNDMRWTELDLAYNYAQNNGLPFKQHTFVWGQQQPGWLSALTLEQQKSEVEEWIRQYSERYPNTDFVDVVNEPLHAPPAYAQALGGSGTTGWDWVIWSFEKAREYLPNAKLILNDYGIINDNNATNNFITIINLLKERNLIDGIGEQGHFFETTPIATLSANLNKLHATKMPIYISEYDVNLADDAAQKAKYEEQFPILWTHPGVRGITLWGYRQGAIWRENAYLVRTNNTIRPALQWLQTYVPGAFGGTFCLDVTANEEIHFGLEVYPNPAPGGKFHVKVDEGIYDLQLINGMGYATTNATLRGGASTLVEVQAAPGIYILQISNGTKSIRRKLLLK